VSGKATASTLVIASDTERDWNDSVWGTGGWIPPADREALDWFTLSRLCGWETDVARLDVVDVLDKVTPDITRIVLACDPDSVSSDLAAMLGNSLMAMPLLVVARAASSGTAIADLSGIAKSATQQAARICAGSPAADMDWHAEAACRCPPHRLAGLCDVGNAGRRARDRRHPRDVALLQP
jgi:hypothetical protein